MGETGYDRSLRRQTDKTWETLRTVRSAQDEVAQPSASGRVGLIPADNVEMGMENVLAGGRANVPSNCETVRLEFGQISLGFVEHLSEVCPLLSAEVEGRFNVPEGNDHRRGIWRIGLRHHKVGAVLRYRFVT